MKNNRDAVHRIHCGISVLDGEKEYPPTCKYGDEDCPVVLEYKTIPESVIIPREEFEKVKDLLRKISCLGNGERFGNSDGNILGQEALAILEKNGGGV
jgi:hypothetical protein